jgi:nitrite reductase/ring-hydroxylating ferredoxin subunit
MPDTNAGSVAPAYRTSTAPAFQTVIAADPHPAHPVFREYSETDVPCASVPRAQYTSQDFARLEQERLWPRVWQMACREEQIPETGDYLVYESPGASLIIVRAAPDEIRAYYNSCLHRGMRLCNGESSVTRFNCPFHGFAWNLDGTLAHVPARWDFPGLQDAAFSLPQARVGRWGGFVFINRDHDAAPLEQYLNHLIPHFADWPRDQVYLAVNIRKTLRANWKTAIEGFVEAFHLAGIHAQALPFGGDASTQYDVWPDDPNVSRFLEPVGVQSDQYPSVLNEQQILDASLRVVFGAGASGASLGPGGRARHVMANATRQAMEQQDGRDYSRLSDSEVADAAQYSLFPNIILFRSLGYPYAYRFLPVRDDPNSCTFDFLIFKPKPAESSDPLPEAMHIALGPDDRFSDCGALPAWLGEIYDQDTEGLAQCQQGLRDGGDADVMYSAYQEVRIRHLHQTLASYVERPPRAT